MPRPRSRRARPEAVLGRDDSPAELARIRREIGGRLNRLRAVIMARRRACAAQGRVLYPEGMEDPALNGSL